MKKRILSVLLAVSMLLSCAPVHAFALDGDTTQQTAQSQSSAAAEPAGQPDTTADSETTDSETTTTDPEPEADSETTADSDAGQAAAPSEDSQAASQGDSQAQSSGPARAPAATFGLGGLGGWGTTSEETLTLTTTLNLPEGEGYAFYDAEGNPVTGQVQVSTDYKVKKNFLQYDVESITPQEPVTLTVKNEDGYEVDTLTRNSLADDWIITAAKLALGADRVEALLDSGVSVEGNKITVNPPTVEESVLENAAFYTGLKNLDKKFWSYDAQVSLVQTTFSVIANGCTVDPADGTKVPRNAGKTTTFTITPITGEDGTQYKVDSVTVDGDPVEVTDNQFAVNNGKDVTIVVNCVPDQSPYTTYHVTVNGNGTSGQDGDTFTVLENGTLTFSPVAEEDSYLESVLVDGQEVTLDEDGTFSVSFAGDKVTKEIVINFARKHTAAIAFVANGSMTYTRDAQTFKQNVYNNIDFANSTLPDGLGVEDFTYYFQTNLYDALSGVLGVDALDQVLGQLGVVGQGIQQGLKEPMWINVDEGTTIGAALDARNLGFVKTFLDQDIINQSVMPSVGEVAVKVAYDAEGQTQYLPGESEGTLTITKASASLHVGNASMVYGEDLPADLITSDPADLNKLVVYVGLDTSAQSFVGIELPNGLLYQAMEQTVTSLYPNGFTLGQLQDVLEALNVAINNDVLTQILANVPAAVMDVKIQLGKAPTETGLYLVGAVSVDGNYTTAYDIGSLAIAPQTADVTLSFNEEMPNKYHLLTLGQDFDFGYTVSQPYAKVAQSFDGVDFAGNPHHSPTDSFINVPGVYTQTVYVCGGNYYANPIVRMYVVRRADVQLHFDNADDSFVYDGAPVDLTATVTDAQGNKVEGAKVIYSYANCNGVELNGLPTDAGTYLVTAAYFGDSQYACAVDVTTITIHKQDLKVTLHDAVKLHGTPEDPEFAYDIDGLQGSDTAQVVISRQPGEDPGDYELTADVTASSNYKVTTNKAVLLIVDVDQPELPSDGEVELGNTTEAILGQELCSAVNEILQGQQPAGMDAKTVEAIQTAIANRETITVELVASVLPDDCADSELVKGALQDGQTVAQYLDFQVEIQANGKEIGLLTELSQPLNLTVDVPEAYQAANRSFGIIRVHGGAAAALEVTQQNNQVRFASNEFSTYALVYADAKKPGHTGGSGSGNNGGSTGSNTSTGSTTQNTAASNQTASQPAAATANTDTAAQTAAVPQTGDESHPLLWGMLFGISALGLAVLVLRKRKQKGE